MLIRVGAIPNYFGVPGDAEHAFQLYKIQDAHKNKALQEAKIKSLES